MEDKISKGTMVVHPCDAAYYQIIFKVTLNDNFCGDLINDGRIDVGFDTGCFNGND